MEEPYEGFDRDAKGDGLGIGLFALLSVMLDELSPILPGADAALSRIRASSIDLIERLVPMVGGVYGEAVRVNALGAIDSVFAATRIADEVPRAPDERD